ncbi:MAG: glycosyltransferase family 39 protein [Bacteroidota bacterium]
MAENFVWGQEWQLGYYKHPPLFAWITALWFKVFPNVDWAYFLLSQVNVIIGLAAIWFLVKIFLSDRHALIAVILLELVPFYTFLSIKFNSHSIMLSLWPLTTLFFCHAYATRRRVPSLLFGIFAALAILSMYYSFCLLAALFLISILRNERRQYYTSFSPYVSVIVLFVVLVPHLFWLFSVDFLPVHYATGHIVSDPLRIITNTAKFAVFTPSGAGLRGDRRRPWHSATTPAQPEL